MRVRKAVIPVSGLGTRFLPGTKAIAKEMLPIVDKPIIQFIAEEALSSGIEDILIVTGKEKRQIEDHFDANIELEINLIEKGKMELLKLVEKTTKVNLYFIHQSHSSGLGHAVLQAKTFVGDEPFIVMLGDDLMVDQVPLTKQLMNDHEEKQASILAVIEGSHQEVSKYGVINPGKEDIPGLYGVNNFIGKPEPENILSNLVIIGRYLLTPRIFSILENQQTGPGDEIQLTDAIDELNKTQQVYARVFEGDRYDIRDKFGYMKTSIEFGLQHPEIGGVLKDYLIELSRHLSNK